MEASYSFILLTIIVLLILVAFMFFTPRRTIKKRHTPLAGIAIGFVLIGLLFDENRFVGYGFIASGIILSIVDIISNRKVSGNH